MSERQTQPLTNGFRVGLGQGLGQGGVVGLGC